MLQLQVEQILRTAEFNIFTDVEKVVLRPHVTRKHEYAGLMPRGHELAGEAEPRPEI